jgi:hypothetical protein
VGAYARGGQTDEFVNKTENLETVLKFDTGVNVHPPALRDHPILKHEDDFLKDKQLSPYFSHEPYNLERVPLIWVWASEGKEPYNRLYNTVDV